jgi:hypothetical protein
LQQYQVKPVRDNEVPPAPSRDTLRSSLTVLFKEARNVGFEVKHATVHPDVRNSPLKPKLAQELNANSERVSKLLFSNGKG